MQVHADVLIIGAGVSGIGIACHLRRTHPERSITILERRGAIGGTWDLFRYPGIRCDSDMYTFGYNFRPWPQDEVITDGESIRTYVRETAAAYGVDRDICFEHRVEKVNWCGDESQWTVEAVHEPSGEIRTFTGSFLVSCSGYYDYDEAHAPSFPGEDRFTGQIIHPQFWPEDLDYAGKNVVIIGSGATAVTLVPAMAEKAGHVTMLQRSPTYIVSLPRVDRISQFLRRFLPDGLVGRLTLVRNLVLGLLLFYACQWFPARMRALIQSGVRKSMGPDVDMRHFEPRYDPWDQRLCVVPDGDLFKSLRSGHASIVTDHVETFTEDGLRLESGRELGADIIVTATGLRIQLLGGVDVEIDGEPVDPTDRLTYKSVMFDGLPNFAFVMGYVHVSWTRKVDMVGAWLGRLLDEMDAKGATVAVPRSYGAPVSDEPFVGLTAGYIQRALDRMPQQGEHTPWRNTQNLLWDWASFRFGPVDDGHLEFSRGRGAAPTRARALPRG